MSRTLRTAVFAVGGVGFAVLLLWGFGGLPDFGDFTGHYGLYLAHHAVPQRVATEAVGVTTFDYRGIDTLGEEFILFAAAVGVLALLRLQRGEEGASAEPARESPSTGHSETLRRTASALAAPCLVLGLYVVAHGHLTPGGGFQGGVVLMSALLLVFLAGARFRRRTKPLEAMELGEASGAAGFALIGLGGILFADAYLENFLPFGDFGQLVSGGVIPLDNLAVGVEVMGATLVVLGEFLDQRFLSGGDA